MKAILAFLLLSALHAQSGEPVILYARLLDSVGAALADGAKWQMEKGDCFPVVAYRESHTKLVLQLASSGFIVPANKAEIVADNDLPAAMANYRASVSKYLDSYSARWRKNAEAGTNK